MPMITSHVYAATEGVRLFLDQSGVGQILRTLHKGAWLGVLKREGQWIHVIGSDFEGWVEATAVEVKSPFSLHARRADLTQIQYVNDEIHGCST